MGRACGAFYDSAFDAKITHFNQDPLNAAVMGAKKRKIGDAGLWGWDRKSVETDISSLVAATLALFGASTTATKAPSMAFAF